MENNEKLEEYLSENYLVVEPQPRWKSWAVWLSFFGAVWVILEAFGLPEKWGVQESTFRTVLDAVGSILIGFGVLNNPTDKANF